MTKQEVKRFLKSHRNLEYSAAKFEYSMFLYKDIEEEMNELLANIDSKLNDIKITDKQKRKYDKKTNRKIQRRRGQER